MSAQFAAVGEMALCENCYTRAERPCAYVLRTREFFDAVIAALRFVAYRCGYALGVHGSLKTDIDLIAAPWRENPVDAEYLAEQIRLTAERIIGIARTRTADSNPTKKPCGRLAWSFYLQPDGVEGPYIDLSVMPVPNAAQIDSVGPGVGSEEPSGTRRARSKR